MGWGGVKGLEYMLVSSMLFWELQLVTLLRHCNYSVAYRFRPQTAVYGISLIVRYSMCRLTLVQAESCVRKLQHQCRARLGWQHNLAS